MEDSRLKKKKMSRYTSISISIFGMILLAVCVLANENLEKINEPLEAEASSNLSKYVKILSKPGAFNKVSESIKIDICTKNIIYGKINLVIFQSKRISLENFSYFFIYKKTK